MKKSEIKLGFWSAIFSASFAIIWFVTFNMQDVFQPVPEWKNLKDYAEAFNISRLTLIYPSLLLALTYIIMLACTHRVLPEDKKLWSLIALSIGILYAVMASINYNIQAVSVRQSLAAGEIAGIEMFIPDNSHSIYNALANSYVYMAISMFFASFIFQSGRLEKWIRGLLMVQIISAVGQIGYSMMDISEIIFIASSMVWVVGAPTSFILIAIWFKKQIPERKTLHD
ncbi:hypothetical protein BY457_10713 [Marinilabilia salmonicolor]|jgi:hypothetical protein|uniref:hypothetical protein n=1 Tax=Marinilabilia salmonicolor TaxID=989 RepID=UPI000D073E8E|nr:hypothetical protein [Marinilabilia salmonicolor]PRY99943.1 hypothetical protein BY457_10713 [Marinilabilia salmonicolor]